MRCRLGTRQTFCFGFNKIKPDTSTRALAHTYGEREIYIYIYASPCVVRAPARLATEPKPNTSHASERTLRLSIVDASTLLYANGRLLRQCSRNAARKREKRGRRRSSRRKNEAVSQPVGQSAIPFGLPLSLELPKAFARCRFVYPPLFDTSKAAGLSTQCASVCFRPASSVGGPSIHTYAFFTRASLAS